MPPFVKTVGVFVDEGPAAINEMIHYCGLDLVQLHGDESPDLCGELMPYTIKALRIKDESSLRTSRIYHGKVRALLLDTYSKDKAGGTGSTFDWQLAIKIKELGIPIILAGGLDPSNIDSAIRTVKPYAVDVNSGVEVYPGKKSPMLMKDLMKKISHAVAARDMDVVREFSHALKGSSANVNAMCLTRAALQLEQSARTGESSQLESHYKTLETEFESFTKEIAS